MLTPVPSRSLCLTVIRVVPMQLDRSSSRKTMIKTSTGAQHQVLIAPYLGDPRANSLEKTFLHGRERKGLDLSLGSMCPHKPYGIR